MGGGESGDGGSATTLETPIRKELSTDPKELGEHNVIYS
jgi:hypothetical protein